MYKHEYIICAAIHYHEDTQSSLNVDDSIQAKNVYSGYVMCGRRHHNVIHLHFALTGKPTRTETSVQGFMTSTNRFLNRRDAMNVAIAAGQVENDETNVGHELISEDLY